MKYCSLVLVLFLLGACAKQGPVASSSPRDMGSKLERQVKIGVILPLSGDYELYGQSSLQGIECAAGMKSPCEALANVSLVVKDSQGSPDATRAAVQQLVQEDGVAAIVGPLMSKTVTVAAQEAQRLGVPMVSLSQRDGVAQLGEHVYRVAMNAQSQVASLVRHAIKEEKLKNFAVLYPDSRYGRAYRDLFRAAAIAEGAEVTAERSYPADLGRVLDAHVAMRDAKENGEQLNVSKRFDFTDKGLIIHDYTERKLPKIHTLGDVDAVFFPDTYRTLLGMLQMYDEELFGDAKLLGVNRWNNSGLLEGGAQLEGALFVGGFFSGSANRETQQFVNMFSQAYGVVPTYLEAQAFDAVQLVAKATAVGVATPTAIQSRMRKLKNYHGVTGGMRFDREGDVRKDLFVLTVANGRINEVASRSGLTAFETAEPMMPYDRPAPAPIVDMHTDAASREAAALRTPAPIHNKYDIGGEAPTKRTALPETKYSDLPVDLAL